MLQIKLQQMLQMNLQQMLQIHVRIITDLAVENDATFIFDQRDINIQLIQTIFKFIWCKDTNIHLHPV